jgi:hypothetical protein
MANGDAAPQTRDIKRSDDYVARLLKLLPAEITGAYLAIRTILEPERHDNDSFIFVFSIIILAIAPFYMYFLLKMRNGLQIVFLMFSYVVWVANVEIERFNYHEQTISYFIDQNFSSMILKTVMGFLVAPAFIKGLLVIWVLLLTPFVFARPLQQGEGE